LTKPAAQDNEDYDVIGPQEFVIGRIFNSIASPPGNLGLGRWPMDFTKTRSLH
jgi:hypothetical protein